MQTALSIPELEEKALWVRRKVLQMAVAANSGHVSTAMSQTEILVALYFGGILRHDPLNPKWGGRDVFLLSKGQGGIGQYPVLAAAGYIPEDYLDTFTREGSHIGVHAEWHCPGIEMISGSLGHGLPFATGVAQAFKDDDKDNLVFCLTGDGELHEGSNWEAMLTASWQGLSNLVLIVDHNDQATLGHLDDYESAKDGPGLEPLKDKLGAFGFEVREINGHSFTGLLDCFDDVRHRLAYQDKPLAVIANTKKGRGLSCMEDKRNFHYKVPSGDDLRQCWDDLRVPAEARPRVVETSQAKHDVAMRDRFFAVLYERFIADKSMVLIAADNGFPAIEKWVAALPGQFVQVGIAEQEMAGMAAGMAKMGKRPFCYAIAPFVTTRIHEFVKLDLAAAETLPITLIGVGAGFAYDIMCITHHTVEDLAIMRVLPNMQILSPSDGVSAGAMADYLSTYPGPSYIRLDRGGLSDLYQTAPDIDRGLSVLRNDGETCIIATGVMSHQALKVADLLGGARVVDLFRIKPLDESVLIEAVGDCNRVVTVEEHQRAGGLSSLVSEVFADRDIHKPHLRLGVPDLFTFDMGGREVIWRKHGLDVPGIVERIRKWRDAYVEQA